MIKEFKFVSKHNKREAVSDFCWGLAVILTGVIGSTLLFMTESASVSTLIESVGGSVAFGLATMWTLVNDSATDLDNRLNS